MKKNKQTTKGKTRTTAKKGRASKGLTKNSVNAKKLAAFNERMTTGKLVAKDKLIAMVSKSAGISIAKATAAYETILKETPSFRQQSLKTVKAKHEVAVKAKSKPTIKTVKVSKDKLVKTKNVVEKIKKVEVIKEVIVERIVEVEKIKEVEVIKRVNVPVIKKVEKIKKVEVIKEVPVEVIKEIEVVKEVEVIKEVPVEVINEVIVEVEVFREVPVEVIKEITMIREVEVVKEIPITIVKEVEIIKEIPVEVVREVEVVKSIDFNSLKKMMAKMGTVEVSKKVVGETRTAQKATIVDRREVGTTSTRGEAKITRGKTRLLTGKEAEESRKNASKSSSKSTFKSFGSIKGEGKGKSKSTKLGGKMTSSGKSGKKDDLKKIEGIGPKIEQLLNTDGIHTFKQLADAKVTRIQKILTAAGPRYKMHNPGSWPKQSNLAAKGKWNELNKLQDVLNGGR